jgi:hypothetical protein
LEKTLRFDGVSTQISNSSALGLSHNLFAMRSSSIIDTNEKNPREKPTIPTLQKTQLDSTKAHVDQNPAAEFPSARTQFEQGAPTPKPESSGVQTQPNNQLLYPHGFKLATITVAVALSVFLVALVCRTFTRYPISIVLS